MRDASELGNHVGVPPVSHPDAPGDPLLLPALLLPDGRRAARAARRRTPVPGRSWRSRISCWSCIGTRSSIRKPELLEHRGGAFYSEAAAQLIASLHDGRGDVQVVDIRNDGALPGPSGQRDRGDPGAHHAKRRGTAEAARARARDARPGAVDEGLRGAGASRRPRRAIAGSRCGRCWPTRWSRAGPWRSRCWRPCWRRAASTCPGSSPRRSPRRADLPRGCARRGHLRDCRLHSAPVAQRIERLPPEQKAVGSSPARARQLLSSQPRATARELRGV